MFTISDLFVGYWQVLKREKCKEMTIFVCLYAKLEFEVIIFGLMNAPSTFQPVMDCMLRKIPLSRV